MADVKQCDGCDGCGKISPENGLYIANNWVKVTLRIPAGTLIPIDRKFDVCEGCFGTNRLADLHSNKGFPTWKKKV